MKVYNNKISVSNYILSVSKRIEQIDGKTRNYGTDQAVFNSEIHIIKAIMENEGIYITALAEMLDVTKGSISEAIRKLEKKDMIIKDTDVNNLSRICLRLTEKGKIAYTNHEELHAKYDNEIEGILENYTDEEKKILLNFFSQLDTTLSEFGE